MHMCMLIPLLRFQFTVLFHPFDALLILVLGVLVAFVKAVVVRQCFFFSSRKHIVFLLPSITNQVSLSSSEIIRSLMFVISGVFLAVFRIIFLDLILNHAISIASTALHDQMIKLS